jgi:pilus assembly protein CpaC
MQVSIRRMMDTPQSTITIPVGRGAMVEADQPVKRASVGDPDVADVFVLSPQQVVVAGKAIGSTELVLWDQNENQIIIEVNVEVDLSEVQSTIRRFAPDAEVEVHGVRDAVILAGRTPDVDTADRIVDIVKTLNPKVQNYMKVAGEQQVLLRVTVAEVNKSSTRLLGVNGWMAGEGVEDIFVVNQLDAINPVNIGGGPTGNINQAGGMLFATDERGLPLTATPSLSLGFPKVQMQLFFNAMRENGLLRVLAEPNLVALNGSEAKFLVGGEIPYPVPQLNGTPAIQFREFGIKLKFTPTVIGRNKIRLTVSPEVSEPDFSLAVQGVPGLRTRSATTTVELTGGSTIAMAGLLSQEVRGQSMKIPGAGDVPILGALFSSNDYQESRSELVILVTPELVSAMNPDQVPAVPGQYMTHPNDFELFGLGMLEGEPLIDESTDDDALTIDIQPKYRKFSSSPEEMSLHGQWGPAEAWETTQ